MTQRADMRYTPKQLAIALVDSIEKNSTQVREAADEVIAILAVQKELSRTRDVMLAVEQVWKQRHGAATIAIESAHPLDAATRKKVGSIASGAEIIENVDENLIGGARVRIDDRIIDGSIAGQLDQLKTMLTK